MGVMLGSEDNTGVLITDVVPQAAAINLVYGWVTLFKKLTVEQLEKGIIS